MPSPRGHDELVEALRRRVWQDVERVLRSRAFLAAVEHPRGPAAPALSRRLDDLISRARLVLAQPSPFAQGSQFATMLDMHLASVLDRAIETDAVHNLRTRSSLPPVDTASDQALNNWILRVVGEQLATVGTGLGDQDEP